MNATPICRFVRGAAVTMTCLMLLGLLAGCSQERAPTAAIAPAAGETAVSEAPIEAAVESPVELASSEPPQPEEIAAGTAAQPEAAPPEEQPVEIGSCDGGEAVKVSKDLTGQPLADALMDQWQRRHPQANWVTAEQEKHALLPPADNSDVLQGEQGKGHPYGNYTELDVLTWARETEKFVAEGSRIFHNADELGSSVSVSCDMCHPHAANTHPETYPKFQAQLGRVALLRDMIDWCLENPVRGEHLDPNGPAMRALEAYIMSQRKGVAMNYGKH